jgi:hypothetical protein
MPAKKKGGVTKGPKKKPTKKDAIRKITGTVVKGNKRYGPKKKK